MRAMLRASQVTAIFALILAWPRPAHAYLDPSTGAMVVSALVSVAATVALGVQAYWHKLMSLVRRGRARPAPGDEARREGPESGPA